MCIRCARRPMLSFPEAAAYLGLPERLLRRWRDLGIPAYRLGGRRLFFDCDELDAWVASHRVEGWS